MCWSTVFPLCWLGQATTIQFATIAEGNLERKRRFTFCSCLEKLLMIYLALNLVTLLVLLKL